jgi:nicotinamide mononucleotide transporter
MLESLPLEQLSVAFAVVYLALAIRQSLWCWPAALISVALWAVVVVGAKLYMDFALQIFYFAMGVYGWIEWLKGGEDHTGVRVHWWSTSLHIWTLLLVLVLSAGFGFALTRTDAQFPYIDSFTTIAAIVTTFMVTRKVMENWIYWFVIDALYVYVYLQRDLVWYAGLYLLYLVMIVFGFRAWLRSLQTDEAVAEDRVAT